jgi:two-component system response regulator GlrR
MSEIGNSERPIGRRRSDRIVGASQAHQGVVEKAAAAARVDLPVVITGPAGSGKEHLSRAIHHWSKRAAEPFVIVSCGAINESLIGREIFGCISNVYPLLPDEYPGALTRAAGGTVLIDDFDQLPELLRKSLITTLSDGTYPREGDATPIPLRARVIVSAAVSQSALQSQSGQSPLGQSPLGDLQFHSIELLSLRERGEDILPLAAHLLRLAADEAGVTPVGFTSDARDALLAEPWPGNVRELSERIRQAVLLAGDGAISAEALLLAGDPDEVPSFKDAKRAFETRYVVGLLRRCGGNISRAARLAKKDRKDFYDVIRRTGVNPSEFR